MKKTLILLIFLMTSSLFAAIPLPDYWWKATVYDTANFHEWIQNINASYLPSVGSGPVLVTINKSAFFQFDGISQYFQAPNIDFSGLTKWMCSAWLYQIDNTGFQSWFSEGAYDVNGFHTLFYPNNGQLLMATDFISLSGGVGTPVGQWYHEVIYYDGSLPMTDHLQIWVNGSRRAATTGAAVYGTVQPSSDPIKIGVGSFLPWNGYIDDVQIFTNQNNISTNIIPLIYANGANPDLIENHNPNLALHFPGGITNSYCSVLSNPSQHATTNITISFWRKFDDDSYGFLGALMGKGFYEWRVTYNNWHTQWGYYDGVDFGGAEVWDNVVNKDWNFTTITWDGHITSIYLNGILLGSTTNNTGTGLMNNEMSPFVLGNATYGSNYRGSFDEVAIWSSAYQSNEVWELYNNNTGTYIQVDNELKSTGRRLGDNLMMLYHCDDGTNVVTDSSGNGNDLIMYNMDAAPWINGKVMPLSLFLFQDIQGNWLLEH